MATTPAERPPSSPWQNAVHEFKRGRGKGQAQRLVGAGRILRIEHPEPLGNGDELRHRLNQKCTPVHELERYMRCKDCSAVRGYPYKRSHLVALRATKISASDPPSTWWPGER
ncbi:hypothetical protein [Bradyrhizobium liaoningense]|uniref:hypothetical protein n=1 Tax=Bradyrhizobium liaoningense TaxID=43992 RepID=UPI001BA98B49|nr:hypothetical protein [Bradyrhizobium liaoningense]MBR0714790.1 hypothetical protein [Bradyrhizobium liaoningense]